MCLLIITVSASEDPPELCTDSDDGPDGGMHPTDEVLKTKASTKYGITTAKDICVIGLETDVYAEESPYVKDYYCDNDKRKSAIFDCRDYGFEKCQDGACIGNGTGATVKRPTRTIRDCGNKILDKDKGEECDPPESVCIEKDNYGMCQDDCSCKWHNPKEPEQTEEDEEIQEEDNEEETEEETEDEEEEDEEDEDEKELPDISERKDFTEEPGIKTTSSIAGFFKKIWNWFTNLF